MDDIGKQITNLMSRNGKTSADMTHALKVLGDGDMQTGFTRIAEYFRVDSANSLTNGRIQGAVGIGTILLVFQLIKGAAKNSKHKKEGKAILNCLEKNLPETKEVDPKETTTEVTEVNSEE